MKYEATIHFEVKDEKVDLTDLVANQKIDVQRECELESCRECRK
jgi:hypothetical protein